MSNNKSQGNTGIFGTIKNNIGTILAFGACFAFAVSIYNLPNEVKDLQQDVKELQGQFEEAYKNQISRGLSGQQHKEVLDLLFKLRQINLSSNNSPEDTK